jgi:DNA-binding NarL/FixJ family response regulator
VKTSKGSDVWSEQESRRDREESGLAKLGNILIADDHPLVRKALSEAIQAAIPDIVVEELDSLAALVGRLRIKSGVSLVLLDLSLPDANGFSGLRTVREHFPHIPVVIFSAQQDDLTINRALNLGASGFIPKSLNISDLNFAIMSILDGDIWTPCPKLLEISGVSALSYAGLTSAQMQVITGLQRGLLNKQIAFELGVTEHTVKAHITAAFKKLGVTNRMQAMVLLGPVNFA